LQVTDIPIVNIDRGGQVTYHAPGQLVAYLLLDIRRKQVAVRDLVMRIEQSIIELLGHYAITAQGDREAPGVYVNGAKIAALGLRVTRGYTYHGLSLNVDMDLSPFQQINPCGYAGLQVTQCKDLGLEQMPFELAGEWVQCFAQQMDYHLLDWCQD
jgi:lipoyl(octanoyl) transferase